MNREKSLKETETSENFLEAEKLVKDKALLFDTIMTAIGDGITIQDLDMKIVYQNKFLIDRFGSHLGEFCYKIYEKRDHTCEGCPVIEAYKTGKVVKSLRIGVTKEGPLRFENIASALRNKQGRIVAGIEVTRMVEEREKALDDLRRFKELATGRELKMIELKKEAERLKKELEK